MVHTRAVSGWSAVGLAAGLVLLVAGAEALVRGAAAISARLGIPPLIVGLTVVAFGTSAPELAVSVGAAATGDADVAFGNVVGSNIVNILLILGVAALVSGLAVSLRVVRVDLPLLVAISGLVVVMALDGRIGRVDATVLVAGLVLHTIWLVRAARRERAAVAVPGTATDVAGRGPGRDVALVFVGLGGLVVGARWFVGAATDLASAVGVSEVVIGLTVVAIGTSLPELATSVLAAIRGQRDIAVGNVVGSNLFNLLGALGVTGLVSGGVEVAPGLLRLDLPVMLAATLVLVPVFWSGFEIHRWEGVALLGAYAAYVSYLVLAVGGHEAAGVVGPAALIVSGVVTVVLVATGVDGWRAHRASTGR